MLSEPYLESRYKYCNKSIKENWVSTAGKKISKFENKISIILNRNIVLHVILVHLLYIALKVLGVKES